MLLAGYSTKNLRPPTLGVNECFLERNMGLSIKPRVRYQPPLNPVPLLLVAIAFSDGGTFAPPPDGSLTKM
jgi:hypothetical protein